jgi:cyclic-di-GMP-binding protein
LNEAEILLRAEQEFHLQQMLDMLRQKLVKRKVSLDCLDIKPPVIALNTAKQQLIIRQGVDAETAKRLVKAIKGSKIKVQAQIQGDQVRVSGKQRNDLQAVILLLRAGDYGLPLQYINFRD